MRAIPSGRPNGRAKPSQKVLLRQQRQGDPRGVGGAGPDQEADGDLGEAHGQETQQQRGAGWDAGPREGAVAVRWEAHERPHLAGPGEVQDAEEARAARSRARSAVSDGGCPMARYLCSSWSRKSSGSFRGGKATRRVFGADPQTGAMPPPSICENTRCIAVPWSQRLTRYRKYSCVQTMLPSMLTKLGPGVRPICRYLPSRAIARNSKGSLRGGNSTARPPPITPIDQRAAAPAARRHPGDLRSDRGLAARARRHGAAGRRRRGRRRAGIRAGAPLVPAAARRRGQTARRERGETYRPQPGSVSVGAHTVLTIGRGDRRERTKP